MRRRAAWLLLIGMLSAPGASAQETDKPEAEIIGARVGVGGAYKVGLWTPVEVTLDVGSLKGPFHGSLPVPEVSLTVPDGDGVPSRVSAAFMRRGVGTVLLYARFGRIESELTVELRIRDRLLARRVFTTAATADDAHFLPAIAATRKVIVCIGVDPPGVEEAVGLLRQEADRRSAVVRLKDFSQLPTRWYGYEGVDVLVLSTSRPEIFARLVPSDLQIVALDEWIWMGGKLVLCVGSQAERALADGSPLAQFAPGSLRQMVTLRETGPLEMYADSAPIQPADGQQSALHVPQLADVEGIIEAREADLPLVVRTARGFGQIVFLAADLDREPLSNWQDRPLLVRKLLGLPAVRTDESQQRSARTDYGYDDLAGQLRSALDQFSDVRVVPFWAVAVLLVVYILLIGPADYFFLRKLTRRMQWTWVTFPTIVLAFSIGAYLLAYRLKGDQVRLNQADLVDVDMASGRVRGTSWANVFSPRTQSFNLSVHPKLPDGTDPENARVLLSWLGLPGGALGGMNPRASNPVMWTESYDLSPEFWYGSNKIRGVPIQVWSTKSFTARWTAQSHLDLEADLVTEGEVPSGTITNTLGFPLSRCLVAYDRWVYELETLEPGESFRLGPMVRRKELKTLLTGRRTVADESKRAYDQESIPYDQSSMDVPYILRAMMFFEDTGGREYTGLSNGYQGFVDLSGLLDTNRAVLVGQAPSGRHGAELLLDGQSVTAQEDKHVTFYRFVFPVKRVGSGQ